MKKISCLIFLSMFITLAKSQSIDLIIEKPILNLPVSQKSERHKMKFTHDQNPLREFDIRLSLDPEYWVYSDVSMYMGKKLTIQYNGDPKALSLLTQSNTKKGAESFYTESKRPQLHYTPQVGWHNDPNGLIYYEGEYHLFYQHNPYEREWGNMHWGHAVSKDLLHWEELPIALYPDEHGTMFSGTAVVDYANTSGFGTKNNPAMVAIYTADKPDIETQCIAYSLDKGRTWTKYEKNPVINSKAKWNSKDTRDPKVFWFEPIKKWVMVLNERDGHSIYNSTNLKDWTFESHLTGFWECPELFELPIDNNTKNKLWVLYGASGTYMLGKFDGKKFNPTSGKHMYTNGAIYAAQTFANLPTTDKRVIQIGWHRIDNPGMPFKSQFSLPSELTLRTTSNGVRLFNQPIKEVEQLHDKKVVDKQSISVNEANQILKQWSNEGALRIKTKLTCLHATTVGLSLYGQPLINYDLNFNLINGAFYTPPQVTSMNLDADIIIDKTSVEVFIDGGHFSYTIERRPHENNKEGFNFWGNMLEIKNLEVYLMKDIWSKKQN